MENDYLWNKNGEDKEVERLEQQLQIFQYRELKPPVLTSKVEVTKPIFSFYSLRFAFGFSVLFVLLLAGGSLLMTKDSQNEARLKTIDLPPEINTSINSAPVKIESEPELVILQNSPESKPKLQFIKTDLRVKKDFPTHKNKKKLPKIRLTTEEKYAYDQLMLALSITGSKLKEVRSKVNGGEEIASEINSIK